MRVASDRRYRFKMKPAALWARINDVEQYQQWWPWLDEFDGLALLAGGVWNCTVRTPLPYAVRFTIAIDEVVNAQSIAATIDGDVTGSALLQISPAKHGCEARLTSSLQPANRLLRTISIAARPIARFGHNWVLDTGAQQFIDQAAAAASSP